MSGTVFKGGFNMRQVNDQSVDLEDWIYDEDAHHPSER